MKRVGLLRVTAAALGGLAVVTALVAFGILASLRSGVVLGGAHAPLWAVPLVAGAAVGVLSWFLLTGSPTAEGASDDYRVTVACAHCGNSVLEDWLLCPHCGSASEVTSPPESSAPTV